MLFEGNGPEIDRHGLVMRFNEAITKGYEADVGRDFDSGRTTGLIRTSWELGFKEVTEKGLLMPEELVIQNVKNLQADPAFDTKGHPAVRVAASWVRQLKHDLLNDAGSQPSTGFVGLAMAVAVARDIGGSVSVYGFGACRPCGKYFDCDGSNSSHTGMGAEAAGVDSFHPFAAERRMRQQVTVCAGQCVTCTSTICNHMPRSARPEPALYSHGCPSRSPLPPSGTARA
jgi:hypothetical protein